MPYCVDVPLRVSERIGGWWISYVNEATKKTINKPHVCAYLRFTAGLIHWWMKWWIDKDLMHIVKFVVFGSTLVLILFVCGGFMWYIFNTPQCCHTAIGESSRLANWQWNYLEWYYQNQSATEHSTTQTQTHHVNISKSRHFTIRLARLLKHMIDTNVSTFLYF